MSNLPFLIDIRLLSIIIWIFPKTIKALILKFIIIQQNQEDK
jgi:hypothetical protein